MLKKDKGSQDKSTFYNEKAQSCMRVRTEEGRRGHRGRAGGGGKTTR